jgi:hypothetical protein
MDRSFWKLSGGRSGSILGAAQVMKIRKLMERRSQ